MTKEIAIHNLFALKLRSRVTSDRQALDMAIKALEQQPKTGHWITDVYMFGRGRHTCSNCGKGQEYTTAFCSWCGADMRGEEE